MAVDARDWLCARCRATLADSIAGVRAAQPTDARDVLHDSARPPARDRGASDPRTNSSPATISPAPLHDEPCSGLLDLSKNRSLVVLPAARGRDHPIRVWWRRPPRHVALPSHGAHPEWPASPHGEKRRWAQAQNDDPWRVFNQFARQPLPTELRAGLHSRPRRDGWTGATRVTGRSHHGSAPNSRAIRFYDRGIRNIRHIYAACRPISFLIGLADPVPCRRLRWYVAALRGIMTAHPFTDPPLDLPGLGTQPLPAGAGKQKSAQHAMRDVLPDKIRNRREKVFSMRPITVASLRHLPALEALVQEARIDDLDCSKAY